MTGKVHALDAAAVAGARHFNALRHGVLSRYVVLPWEDADAYGDLLDALVAEHVPEGPTEEHLVEELAGIVWRKRRLRMAETAAYHHGLVNALDSDEHTVGAALAHLDVKNPAQREAAAAVHASPDDTRRDLQDLEDDQVMTEKALQLLRAGKPDAYDKALAAVRADTRTWWQEQLEDADEDDEHEHPYAPDADSLQRFLEGDVTDWYDTRRKELENRPLIRAQAFAEAFDPDRFERLARYETHLDRKLERTLAMLLKLKDLRAAG